VLSLGRWGLLPHWAKDARAAARMINARSETVVTAAAYRDAFATRRALVPIDGWYEWRREPAGAGGPGTRQAYFLTPRDGSVLALAGLWSRWGPERRLTFSVITTAAVGELATVHDRMPLVLPPGRWPQWLAGPAPVELLAPPAAVVAAAMEIRPVGPAVGNVRNDGPELVKRVDPAGIEESAWPTLF
jgi:putative SOS response-associated peptidase YedK